MNKLSTSVKSAAVAAVLAAVASASATAGDTTTQSEFAAVAQLPVTALSTSEMAETRGAGDLNVGDRFGSLSLRVYVPEDTAGDHRLVWIDVSNGGLR